MTPQQKEQIEKYREQYEENCSKYASWGTGSDCSFSLRKSKDENDKNYTILMTIVAGITDDFQPYVETVNLMVEPDGNVINLMDFFDSEKVINYIEQLIKVD
jgi:hypothetical protein